MNRSEMAVTVLGLVGTFLLPWPGGRGSNEPVARGDDVPVQAASPAANGQRCFGSPLGQGYIGGRESAATVSAGRG